MGLKLFFSMLFIGLLFASTLGVHTFTSMHSKVNEQLRLLDNENDMNFCDGCMILTGFIESK
eukprot:Pgem_evm1s8953